MADEVLLDAPSPWAPRVLRRDDRLLYELPVASGFADFVVELPIERHDLDALAADTERYWFLFTALHQPFQLQETRLDDAGVARYLRTILHGGRAEVEAFLTGLDHGRANGSLSNLLRIFVDADTDRLRAGAWFGALRSPAG